MADSKDSGSKDSGATNMAAWHKAADSCKPLGSADTSKSK